MDMALQKSSLAKPVKGQLTFFSLPDKRFEACGFALGDMRFSFDTGIQIVFHATLPGNHEKPDATDPQQNP